MTKPVTRCGWVSDDPLYVKYHDREWGVPVYSERKLFEMLILEGAQAGLSWITILKKRAHYRKVFDRFDPEKIALYDKRKVNSLLKDPGIVRNHLKVKSTISNAQRYLELKEQEGRFSDFLWQFVDGKPVVNKWETLEEVPAKTAQSDAMSKALKARGFKFVGTTICYAFMQAVGMVNDHMVDCDFRSPSRN
ncbi:MAG: DNA-3-methyladenine glycosylase I [Pseudomonadota bacterium]|nr:DNA-3-methyladenine glycosylase I [Pseudomonadota bacterium]